MLPTHRKLVVVARVLATVRLESPFVLLKFFGKFASGLARLNRVQQDLLEYDQENHQTRHQEERLLPVGKEHKATEADKATDNEALRDHAILVVLI